ncbi:uncharacterized protein G2W53_022276 [Senna tora]|uniref:Uncharacterized protein n=1 Tax=Senna tora TaxID=362788 RepID=A0A834TME6_9FABA|nr:uncharacterized protein G2W53_022276 [Senna tora]
MEHNDGVSVNPHIMKKSKDTMKYIGPNRIYKSYLANRDASEEPKNRRCVV